MMECYWLYVGGLNKQTSSENLRQYFGTWGSLCRWLISLDSHGVSQGFGFVGFWDSAPLDMVQAARPHILNGCTLLTRRSVGPGLENLDNMVNTEPSMGLTVWGFPPDVPIRMLRRLFGHYGVINDMETSSYFTEGYHYGSVHVLFNDYDPVDIITMLPSLVICSAECGMEPDAPGQDWNEHSNYNPGGVRSQNLAVLRQNTKLENKMLRSKSFKADINPKTGQSRKRKRANTVDDVSSLKKAKLTNKKFDEKTAKDRDTRIHEQQQAYILLKSAPQVMRELENELATTEVKKNNIEDQLRNTEKALRGSSPAEGGSDGQTKGDDKENGESGEARLKEELSKGVQGDKVQVQLTRNDQKILEESSQCKGVNDDHDKEDDKECKEKVKLQEELMYIQKMFMKQQASLESFKLLLEKTKNEHKCPICKTGLNSTVFTCGHACCRMCCKKIITCFVCKERVSHKLVLL